MKLIKITKHASYAHILIIVFLTISLAITNSLKLKSILTPTEILYKEDLLLKSYIDSIKDTRQKHLLLKKLNLLHEINNVQRKKIFAEEIFFDDYSNQMNEYSVYSKKSKDYENFKYLTYTQIEERLNRFENRHPKLIQVNTAQKLYGLQNPIGDCGGKPCENFVVFLGNKEKFKNDTPQMYISCEVHGDEKVGPTLCMEFIDFILGQYQKDKWITFLLDNRRVIITPMTNAYGYYLGMREEIVDNKNNGESKIDPNRDFPMLKRKSECMMTITARTINEIFINNLIRFSLSIHAGTSSLTYAWGTPNHFKNIEEKYNLSSKNSTLNKDEVLEAYYSGVFDEIENESQNSPDSTGLDLISKILAFNSNPNSDFQYKTGMMNTLVYPTRGAFEDWAYSGSWEGSPTITQPCMPSTYGSYNKTKTEYDNNYPNAIKAVSLLLETSESKSPPEVNLGLRRTECFLNIIRNPFKPEIDNFVVNECLNNTFNGFISKNIRLLLINVDLLQPYINVIYSIVKPKGDNYLISLKWIVGGSHTVDETFVIYDLVEKDDTKFEEYVKKMTENNFKGVKDDLLSDAGSLYKPQISKIQNGSGIWNVNGHYYDFVFEEILRIPKIGLGSDKFDKGNNKSVKIMILAKVDQNWKDQVNPDPTVSPQTHFINERINPDYKAENKGFVIKGKNYFYSDIIYKSTN